jgi:hypothetical protein
LVQRAVRFFAVLFSTGNSTHSKEQNMASKVSMVVTYIPTEEEQPMLAGQPQAAIITGWDEETEKADLVVFPKGAHYVMTKAGAVEGTVPGTFQQPATEAPSGTSSTHSASSAPAGTVHKKVA